ncbi:MAG: anti-sigma factor family protein [Myxococcales bacterium]
MTARLPSEPTCQQIVELVTDYLEGRMPPDERTEFEQHLVYCGGCRTYLQQIRQTIAVAGAAKEEALTPSQQEELVRLFRGWKGKP